MRADSEFTAAASPHAEDEYIIREASDISELAELIKVFQTVFRLEDIATPPVWLTQDTIKAGGLMLGLWHRDTPVGFSYGFAGMENGVPYLYSSGLGVLPEHRSHGHAVSMKLAQREAALQRGYERITWTYSALRSVNAHLYISRLGAVGTKYVVDYRGSHTDDWGTEGGVALDEFAVDWQINSDRVISRIDAGAPRLSLDSIPCISECSGEAPEVVLEAIREPDGLDRVRCEVPPDFQTLADHVSPLAHDWRVKTRSIFPKLFDNGLVLSECVYDRATGRAYYVFERADLVV
jgi:predicted GNAT superfamily acetyltransferase